MHPIRDIMVTNVNECSAGDIVLTRVQDKLLAMFVCNIREIRSSIYLNGPSPFRPNSLSSLSKASFKLMGMSIMDSLRADIEKATPSTVSDFSSGDLYYDRGNWGFIVSSYGDSIVIGLDGNTIDDPWGSNTLVFSDWRLDLVDKAGLIQTIVNHPLN
jgi:hypothetical protein